MTLTCLVVGIALAVLLERTAVRWSAGWHTLVALPLAIPSYVAAYCWISAAPWLAGFWGAWLVLSLSCVPYVFLPVAAALRTLDPGLEEISRSLGVRSAGTFWRVVLPQLRTSAAAGGLLVALYVLSDFGAVSLMRYDTFTRAIFTSLNAGFDRTIAVVLSGMLVVATGLIVLLESWTRGRAGYARIGGGAARRVARSVFGGRQPVPQSVLIAVAAISLGFPAYSLISWLLRGQSGALDWPRLLGSIQGSLLLAAGGAALTMLLAIPVGIIAARNDGPFARTIERLAYLGHAVPAVVVALALVFFTVRSAPALYLSAPLVMLAYAVLFLPLGVVAVRSSVLQTPPILEDVARSLGDRPRSVLARVTVPLAAPGIAASTALVFLAAMKELTATLMLHPTGLDTLSIRLWSETFTRSYAAAAPYAAALVIVAALPTYLLGRRRD